MRGTAVVNNSFSENHTFLSQELTWRPEREQLPGDETKAEFPTTGHFNLEDLAFPTI